MVRLGFNVFKGLPLFYNVTIVFPIFGDNIVYLEIDNCGENLFEDIKRTNFKIYPEIPVLELRKLFYLDVKVYEQ